MAKVKFHELAKELGVTQADLKACLETDGVVVRSAVSLLPEDVAEKARRAFGKSTAVEAPPKAKRVPAAAVGGPAVVEAVEQAAAIPAAEVAAPGAVAPEVIAAQPSAPAQAAAAAPPGAPAAAGAPAAPAGVEREVAPIEVRPVRPAAARRAPVPPVVPPTPAPAPQPPAAGKPESVERAGRTTRFDRLPFPRARPRFRPRPRGARKAAKEPAAPAPPPERAVVRAPLTVREFASALGTDAAKVLGALLDLGIVGDINRMLDADLLKRVGESLGRPVELEEAPEAAPAPVGEHLRPRPPVVTIMGHVDHGKTTLLDCIRKSNITAQEFGGITQHIGAYQVEVAGRKITFLDTPGHEAFTAMRARGARVTDIAVIVVGADDGVMPQTIEAIDHARAANVPMVVAINKIDLQNANADRVVRQLADQGLVPEQYGGDTVCVPISAKQGTAVDHLLEMILLVADMQELKGDPRASTMGTIVEAELDRQRGPVATVLVQQGTLRVGDWVIAGVTTGRVRSMSDEHMQPVEAGDPSAPVQITGLDAVPAAGDLLEAVPDERMVARLAESRQALRRADHERQRVRLTEVYQQALAGAVKELNVILKTDVQGSAGAIGKAMEELGTEELRVRILHTGVGEVTESDVMLASASDAIIIGFNVRAEQPARQAASEQGVDVRLYRVIYDILEDVRKALVGMLEPEYHEAILGRAEVRALFKIRRLGTVAGCFISEGAVRRGEKMRVLRNGETVYDGQLDSLKHFKEDAAEISAGSECGISSSGFNDYQEGDVIEVYRVVEVRRETL